MRRCLATLLGVIVCLGATQAMAERRVALVVGNAQYANAPALPNPRNDAQDISSLLKKVGFEVTVGYDLDQTNFARTIDDFARALEGADVGLFFYAGHGLQINEKNYLVSTGAKLESTFLVPSETMELDAIVRLMESKASTNLIFLDACRNNPLTDNLKRNLAAVSRSTTVGRGLARIEPTGRDTLVAFSATPGQEAADGRGRNSPFTASLLRHLAKPGLEVSVMLKEVAADVRGETHNAQRPQQLSDMSKPFYFVKAEPAAPAPAAAIPAASPVAPVDPVDLQFWQSAAAANECESIRAYIREFPAGKFINLAHISERRLCKTDPEVATQRPSSQSVAPALVPGPAAPVAPAPPVVVGSPDPVTNVGVAAPTAPPPSVTPAPGPEAPTAAVPSGIVGPLDPVTNVAVAAPTPPPPAAPAATPVVAPTLVDVARDLQKELIRVGCGTNGIEIDGIWGPASRDALRSFNEHTRSAVAIDRPTPEALEEVRNHKDRVCSINCKPGTELRGTTCVAKPPERSRHASPSPERGRDQPVQAQRNVEPSRAEAPPSGLGSGGGYNRIESWIYVGKQRCMVLAGRGQVRDARPVCQ
jgi:hypothetical protein